MEVLHGFYLESEKKIRKTCRYIITSLRRLDGNVEEGLGSNGNILELEHFRLTLNGRILEFGRAAYGHRDINVFNTCHL